MSTTAFTSRMAYALVLLNCLMVDSHAQNERRVSVRQSDNIRSEFFVRVSVDRNDHIYQDGDEIQITVESGGDGWLYLFALEDNNQVFCLFPNFVQKENRILAKRKITVPAANADFSLKVSAPYGTETIKAIVTKQPLSALEITQLQKKQFTLIDEPTQKRIVLQDLRSDRDWATHQVKITTMAHRRPARQSGPRRIGIFIGCGIYQYSGMIPNIPACGNDAQQLRATMISRCKLDETHLLINEHATLANVKALFDKLVAESKPGDEIVIYWSGHGTRISDLGGEEKDGLDEIYLLHDSNVANVQTTFRTCVTDDMLGNWVLKLSNRKVFLILDTCHSGGSANNEKGFDVPFLRIPANGGLDLIDDDLNRTKDIGQENVIVLASSKARQKSFIRTEGDMSVLTYELKRLLLQNTNRLSVQRLFQMVQVSVLNYTKERYDAIQTPVLIGDEKMQFPVVP